MSQVRRTGGCEAGPESVLPARLSADHGQNITSGPARESVLSIGTQSSNLYIAVDTPDEAGCSMFSILSHPNTTLLRAFWTHARTPRLEDHGLGPMRSGDLISGPPNTVRSSYHGCKLHLTARLCSILTEHFCSSSV
jgi:hypothetical protein